MKVAIDSGPTTSGHAIRGVGFYTKNLTKALSENVYPIDVNSEDLSKYDLIHIPYFNPLLNTLPIGIEKYKYIITIHDLIPLLYPDHYVPGLKGKIRFVRQKRLAQNAQAIITDSETSKKDIVRFLEIDEKKIYPIRLAPSDHFKKITDKKKLDSVSEKYKLPDKFVLYVGDINYNKNIPNLIKACKLANTPLVICGKQALEIENLGEDIRNLKGPMDWIRFLLGKPHPELSHYKTVLKLVKNNPKVLRLGFVPDEDIVSIYNLATVYCQPALYEGFGLPLIEALASETPVVSSKTQALVELGQDACVYFNPSDPEDMSNKILELIKNKELRKRKVNNGLKIVKHLSWDKTAKETLNVYKMVAGK